ncbi:Unknown protein [Striga hermonthica]|uniref:Uncharacterized protein n=1 Tax=Striga hermonthica TaxID=68872 RepID=A0A9N7RF20_STRHE|nr:Unknown protein [Striga hermonthica]
MDPSADLQVWNNAAFDNNGEISEDLSWGSLMSIFSNPKASFDSVSDKENVGGRRMRRRLMTNMKALDFKKTGAEPKSQKRGISLGPIEILPGDINEEKSISRKTSKKGFSSVSPKSRRAVTTISTRKASKKDDSVLNSVQPKKLFGEGENTGFASFVASKKPSRRSGRVVKCDANKRAFSVGKSQASSAAGESKNSEVENRRVKKRWEIPSEIVLLPKIKITQCVKESPRDTGPATKVVELFGKKSFFTKNYEEVEPPVCQALTYGEEEEEVEEDDG